MRARTLIVVGIAAWGLIGCDSRGPKERELDRNLTQIDDPAQKAVADAVIRPMARSADQEYANATPEQQRLMDQFERIGQQTCSRCNGDGFVDAGEIVRAGKVGWLPGKCQLCGGTGTGILLFDPSSRQEAIKPRANSKQTNPEERGPSDLGTSTLRPQTPLGLETQWKALHEIDTTSMPESRSTIRWTKPKGVAHDRDVIVAGTAPVLEPEYLFAFRLTPRFTSVMNEVVCPRRRWRRLREGGWLILRKREDAPPTHFLIMADPSTWEPIRHRSKSLAKAYTQKYFCSTQVLWLQIEIPPDYQPG